MRTLFSRSTRPAILAPLLACAVACQPGGTASGPTQRSDAATRTVVTAKEREFVASESDFEGFMSWRRVDLGELAIGGHPSGHRFVFVNQRIPQGKTAYPTGAIVVHAVARDPDPLRWELFAMVKRGGRFNYDRARGWEFIVLRVDSANHAIFEARGTDPHSAHENQYVNGEGGCNGCHGHVDAREVDGMISRALQPGG